MRILLALDDGPRAMTEALRLAADRGAELTALFVLDTGWSVYTGHDFLLGSHARGTFLDYARDDELAQERAIVAELEAKAAQLGLPVTVKTAAAGRVTEAIQKELGEGTYDLLVMSHPFRRGLEIMRDAAAVVLKEANCDVHFVKRDE